MKINSRHIVEIDVHADVGVSFAVRESGKLVVRAESGKSVEDAIRMLRATADAMQNAATQQEAAAA